jgi:UDP-2,3-diacylglucosamine pyrophosphatase LpxH
MPVPVIMATCLLLVGLVARAQKPAVKEIAFVSDTQAPMWIENVFLKANQNVKATRLIFEDIIKAKPMALYLLGDIVSLGYRDKKWRNIDEYIAQCREQGIEVHGLLGNHDLMGRPKRGEINFQKRFPSHVRTGFISTMDSIAVVLVNSNFSRLTAAEINQQQAWYEAALSTLDKDPKVMAVIVTCHHAPYSNSKLVGSSIPVQTHFVPAFLKARKSVLFITGHSHTFEHFKQSGKNFLVIGGGGGLHQPLRTRLEDTASKYKPMFHYLTVKRSGEKLLVLSHFLKPDFSGFEKSYEFALTIPPQ